jgi:hypothetical protein
VSSPSRPLSEALHDVPEAARLLARWEASQRVARSIAPVCRSLASGFDPLLPGRCEVRDSVLLLTAASTAQSAKLRQVAPRLLSTLGETGIQVYEIRVRVQPGFTGYPEQGSAGPSSADAPWLHPAPSAGETVGKLALTVRDSPLKHAVERLAATLTKRAKR